MRTLAGVLALAALLPATAAAAPAEPTNTSPPSVAGADAPQDGRILTATEGRWTAPQGQTVRYRYEWLRCEGPACTRIPAATARNYRAGAADVGRQVRVRVFGRYCDAPELCGERAAESAPTRPVAPDPVNQAAPEISGSAREGEVLAASTGFWRSAADLSYAYQWLRCEPTGGPCTDVPGATGREYRAGAADAGQRLRVAVTASNRRPRQATTVSAPTAPVERVASAAPRPRPRARLRPRLLSPFPTVVIAGVSTGSGARLSEFTVRGPRGALVTVRCRGRRCPLRRRVLRLRGRALRVRALERSLPAGAVIELKVARPGFIGKFSRFLIRSSGAPKRRDLCIAPGARRPSRCPRGR